MYNSVDLLKDPKERFSATAAKYHQYRPSYPEALVDWILAITGLSKPRVVDVGCGTGISTRLFARRGLDVVGIDPNDEMLAYARSLGEARYQKGESTATSLADRSVDLVIVAQAFHWFNVPKTLAEFRRILIPDGWCAAFWNLRASTPFLDAYRRLLEEFSVEYDVLNGPERAMREIKRAVSVREAEFPNRQILDRDGFFGRVWSSSYVVHGVERRDEFERRLNELFDRYQSGGTVEFAYRTVALIHRPDR